MSALSETDTHSRWHIPSAVMIFIISASLFALSLIPILYVAPAVRATGDDLGYGAGVHHAIVHNLGAAGILDAIRSQIISSWHSWQGTWSSIALFCLEPGVWGDSCYPITVAVALCCIVGGTGYFLSVIERTIGISSRWIRWSHILLIGILCIQYMPKVRGGIFWWTSVAHYCIPYGVAMACMGWSIRWLQTGGKRFMTGMALGMSYLGGAGYPAIVLGMCWFFIMFLSSLFRAHYSETTFESSSSYIRKSAALLLPLVLEIAGFIVSAAAPGNKVRGGEDFGFSFTRVAGAVAGCLLEGLTEGLRYFITVRPLILFLLLTAGLIWEYYEPDQADFHVKHPLILAAVCFILSCVVRAPVIYAGVEPSGGVPDSYWFITLVMMTITVTGAVCWCRDRIFRKQTSIDGNRSVELRPVQPDSFNRCRTDWLRKHPGTVSFYLCLVICCLFIRHLIGPTADYTCITFVESGAFSDYKVQMQEWLDLLNDPSIRNVKLPAMNSEQGPFMLMVPLEEDGGFTNTVYEQYYDKESVVCVPGTGSGSTDERE